MPCAPNQAINGPGIPHALRGPHAIPARMGVVFVAAAVAFSCSQTTQLAGHRRLRLPP